MKHTVASALLAMGMAVTRQSAQQWADTAAERGATPSQLAAAWAAWEQIATYDVQTIGVTEGAPCRCSHVHACRCPSRACGCTRYRPTTQETSA